MAKFCGECGAARLPEARFCSECGTRFLSVTSTASMQVPSLTKNSGGLDTLTAPPTREGHPPWSTLQSAWWISGTFNVEGGYAAVTTRFFESCDCHMAPQGDEPCEICGRTSSTSLACPSGHGDGVYPVFTLEDGNGRATGAVAFFVEEWALGVESKSKAPSDIAGSAVPLFVGTIECTGTLMFSEACAGLGGNNVIVDTQVPPGQYEVIAWLGDVPTVRRGGMEPFIRPIAMGVYGRGLVQALEEESPPNRNPQAWEAFQPWNTMMWGVMAHREPRWGMAAMYNYRDDMARGARDRAMSWLLQAAAHGDQEALTEVGGILTSTDPAVVTERRRLLALRGQPGR